MSPRGHAYGIPEAYREPMAHTREGPYQYVAQGMWLQSRRERTAAITPGLHSIPFILFSTYTTHKPLWPLQGLLGCSVLSSHPAPLWDQCLFLDWVTLGLLVVTFPLSQPGVTFKVRALVSCWPCSSLAPRQRGNSRSEVSWRTL